VGEGGREKGERKSEWEKKRMKRGGETKESEKKEGRE
jgi:hypothetical protein